MPLFDGLCEKNKCRNIAALDIFFGFVSLDNGSVSVLDILGSSITSLSTPGIRFNVILVNCGSMKCFGELPPTAPVTTAPPAMLLSEMPIVLVVDNVVSRSNNFFSHENSCICESYDDEGLASSGNGPLAESNEILRCCDAISDGMCCENVIRL